MTDWIEQFERETPEPKLELIDGRLIIGNSLAGSRYYLHDLLTGWGTQAVLPFAPPGLWWAALCKSFGQYAPPEASAPRAAWQTWAEKVGFEPWLAPAGPRSTGPHHFTRERLSFGISGACGIGGFGISLGHDFVMRLGDNGFTPDGLLVGRQATERLFERYLNGPADLVWEVLLPGHKRQDQELKRNFFEVGGVPHYWIFDPEAQTVDFLHLVNGKYQREPLDADGRYRPAAVPGLALLPERLWQKHLPADIRVFEVEAALPARWSHQSQEGIGWDHVGFVPKPGLEPRPVLFEEFASWCPRAKFEGYDNRSVIGGHLGTRNVLGMLLRTFGLIETVPLLHPRTWVAGLQQAELARRGDADRKTRWWDLARQAAARLRAKHKVPRIAVIGDLTSPEPLHFWSELSLVVWDLPGSTFDSYHLIRDMDTERVIDIIRPEHATRAQQRMIEEDAVAVD